MNPLTAIGTFLGIFAVVLAINVVLRVLTMGFDSILDFSWVGIAIAAGIAVAATFAEEGRREKNENGRS